MDAWSGGLTGLRWSARLPWRACRHAVQSGEPAHDAGQALHADLPAGPEPWRDFAPVWQRFHGDRHAVDLGFKGDATSHLPWRIEHGEADGISPRAAVVLIGANNFGHLHRSAADTLLGIDAIVALAAPPRPAPCLEAGASRPWTRPCSRNAFHGRRLWRSSRLQAWGEAPGLSFRTSNRGTTALPRGSKMEARPGASAPGPASAWAGGTMAGTVPQARSSGFQRPWRLAGLGRAPPCLLPSLAALAFPPGVGDNARAFGVRLECAR